jgi:hypothetical protein
MARATASPMSAGLSAISMPASFKAAIFFARRPLAVANQTVGGKSNYGVALSVNRAPLMADYSTCIARNLLNESQGIVDCLFSWKRSRNIGR